MCKARIATPIGTPADSKLVDKGREKIHSVENMVHGSNGHHELAEV